MNDAKHPVASKTIWLNALALIVPFAMSHTEILKPFVPADIAAYMAFFLPIANIVLRAMTGQPLSLNAGKDQ